jgi:SMI1/KNR4 family protein SUKH-1
VWAVGAFDEVKQHFWDPAHDYQLEPVLTDAALAAAEHELGVTLPAAYIELLRIQNGGVPAREFTYFATGSDPDYVMLDDMPGLGELLKNRQYTDIWEMPAALLLLSGDGHTWIALDYRETGSEPPIVWWDNELEVNFRLAADFRTFVEALGPNPYAEPVDPFDELPPRHHRLDGRSSIATKIKLLRLDLARYQAGERSLAATRAWLERRPREVLDRLPRWRTGRLRKAAKAFRTVEPDALPAAVDAAVAELEALLPRWLELDDTMTRWLDEEYAGRL